MKPKPSDIIFMGCLFLFVVLQGCSIASGKPSSGTATAQAVRAIDMATHVAQNMQATIQVEQERVQATQMAHIDRLESSRTWPEVMNDPFDEPVNDWPLGEGDDPLATIEWDISEGKYHWQATANEGFVWWVYPRITSVADFYLETTAHFVEGPETGEYGLIFRLTPEDSYYLFEISGNQQFAFFINDQGEWETLIAWQISPVILTNGANRLVVIGRGPQFDFYINDQWIVQGFDDRLDSGKVGLLIGLSTADQDGVWEFDDFILRAPQQDQNQD